METLELKRDKTYNKLKLDILSGKRLSGAKLPSEIDLARELRVARITLRSSLERLEHDGYIKRIHGKGTFVHPDSSTASRAGIMVIQGAGNGFEFSWNCIVPEITRCAVGKNLKIFITSDTLIKMLSVNDIRQYVKFNHITGIIAVISSFVDAKPVLEKIRSAGTGAVITIGRMDDVKNAGFANISALEKEGWEAAIAYLAGLGHRNIGVIGHPVASFRGLSIEEMLKLLKKYDVSPDESLICKVDFNRLDIIKTVNTFCSNSVGTATAILCYSDFYAIYVYDALKKLKLRIPQDVAVMGFGGYPDVVFLDPPLSTIDCGYGELAEIALEMLEYPEKMIDPSAKNELNRIKPYKLLKKSSSEY